MSAGRRAHEPGRPGQPTAGRWAAPRRWGLAVASAAVALTVGGACGVPLDDHARAADPADVPYGLMEPSTSTTVSAGEPEAAMVYLVQEDRLVPVTRELDRPVDAARLVSELASELSPEERSRGLRRAFGGTDLVAAVTQTGTLSTIELSEGFERLPAREQVLALGQIVFTVTGLDGVDQVHFTRDHEALDVPTGDATLTNAPVDRGDYDELLAPGVSAAG